MCHLGNDLVNFFSADFLDSLFLTKFLSRALMRKIRVDVRSLLEILISVFPGFRSLLKFRIYVVDFGSSKLADCNCYVIVQR